MHYAYIRVSTDKQTTETQRFEILKFADQNKLAIDQWIEETVSGTKKVQERKLGLLLPTLQPQDVLIVTEISRLGRSLMEVMSFLHTLMEREVTVYTIKEGYTLGNNLNSGRVAQWNRKPDKRHQVCRMARVIVVTTWGYAQCSAGVPAHSAGMAATHLVVALRPTQNYSGLTR